MVSGARHGNFHELLRDFQKIDENSGKETDPDVRYFLLRFILFENDRSTSGGAP